MMYLEIITPEKMLYTGEIRIIKLPGELGSFEILENHASFISTLTQGTIRVKDTSGIISFFDINGGLVEVLNNEVKVLVE